MNPSQDFGAAFRAQRLAAGFTQAALAQRAGCRRQTIVAIEAGQNIECHFQKATARNVRSRLHGLSGLFFAGAFHVQNSVKQCH